jgi:hypothetical protein
MRTWLALIIAPSLALACQSIMYALVTPSCSLQTRVLVHLVGAAALALAAVLALLARGDWIHYAAGVADGPDNDTADPANARRFLAAVVRAVASLSALVILMMWFAAWVLSPCWQ